MQLWNDAILKTKHGWRISSVLSMKKRTKYLDYVYYFPGTNL